MEMMGLVGSWRWLPEWRRWAVGGVRGALVPARDREVRKTRGKMLHCAGTIMMPCAVSRVPCMTLCLARTQRIHVHMTT